MTSFTNPKDLSKFIGDHLDAVDSLGISVDGLRKDHYEHLLTSPEVSKKFHVTQTHDGWDVTKKKPSIETCFGSHSKDKAVNEDASGFGAKAHTEHSMHSLAPVPKTANIHNLNDYSMDSQSVNTLLHGLHEGSYTKVLPNAHRLQHARQLDKDFEGAATHDDMTVYTGLRRSPFEHFGEGDHFVDVHHPAFLSTSTSFAPTQEFAKFHDKPTDSQLEMHGIRKGNELAQHFLKINVPTGAAAMSLRDVSNHPNENEVLIHRGHDIRIHSHPEVHHVDQNTTHYVWHADLMGHNPSILPRRLDDGRQDHPAIPGLSVKE